MEILFIVLVAIIALYLVFRVIKSLIKWVLILLVVALAVAYFTNPSSSRHLASLKEKTENLPVKIKDDALMVNDYKILSVAKIKTEEDEKIIGIGAFGKVWYIEDLKNTLLH